MISRRILAALALSIASLCLGAQATLLSQVVDGRYQIYEVRDATGIPVTVVAEGPLNESQVDRLYRLREHAAALTILRVRSARVVVSGESIEASLTLSAYTHRGTDLLPFLPAGIQLYFGDELMYDFRALVGHYFLRIKGRFEDDVKLAAFLQRALEAPGEFLQADTDATIGARLSGLDKWVVDLQAADSAQTRSIDKLQENVEEIKSGPAPVGRVDLGPLTARVAALETDVAGIRTDAGRTRTDIADLRRLYESLTAADTGGADLAAQYDALQSRYGSLAGEVDTLRTAMLVLNNRRGRQVNSAAVDRLLALKKQEPRLTQQQAGRMLKDEGLALSDREISLVYALYFAQFE